MEGWRAVRLNDPRALMLQPTGKRLPEKNVQGGWINAV